MQRQRRHRGVGPGRFCSPRHRVPFKKKIAGSKWVERRGGQYLLRPYHGFDVALLLVAHAGAGGGAEAGGPRPRQLPQVERHAPRAYTTPLFTST
jgi:hypothetical protein